MTAARTRVKICGITRPEDAERAAAAGADAIGLVFYPASPRALDDMALAREIADAAGAFVTVTGLFVDPDRVLVERVLSRVALNLLQFHGSESAAFCGQFDRPYMKALRMKNGLDVTGAIDTYQTASAILLDAYRPGVPGGTGEVFDWQRVPKHSPRPIVLAGGLKPDNVAVAVDQVAPYGVDVSGGVESAPGIKDADKVAAFIRRAKFGDES